jgi:putative NIF3 family GTP cyclohydrolase 1 type 2
LDNVRSGVNACLGRTLGLVNTDFLQPNGSLPDAGGGIIGELEAPMEESEFLSMVKKQLLLPVLRHSRLRGKPVRRVAACGGAGGFMLQDAIRRQADVFLVGEAHYHDFIDYQDRILMLETGHYESECLIKSEIFARLNEKFGNFAISKTERTPYYYW